MTALPQTYRWNTSRAAAAYDAAAPAVHPFYTAVQDQILAQLALAFDESDAFLLVDLGGGSGRLVERILDQFPRATALLVDQSEPFLAIAERRLARFSRRGQVVQERLQGDWASKLPAAPQAIVSMSAIHHLEPAEKRALYSHCYEALAPGGVFINGDEFRPESDEEYLALLKQWATHMQSGIDNGLIPAEFQDTFDQWHDRNIMRFGAPKRSGDDCLETLTVQRGYILSIGFKSAEIVWNEQLWGVVRARK
jgi:SAM-dependent methyltransferase